MKWMGFVLLTLLAAGCTNVSQSAICEGTIAARDAHADALFAGDCDQCTITGAHLIALIDAGCGDG